jgi:hypothetical protein
MSGFKFVKVRFAAVWQTYLVKELVTLCGRNPYLVYKLVPT